MPAEKIKIIRPWVFHTVTIGIPTLVIISIIIAIAEQGSGIDYIRNQSRQWLKASLKAVDLSSAPDWIISSFQYFQAVISPMVRSFFWLCFHLVRTKVFSPVSSWSVFLLQAVSTMEVSPNEVGWITGCVWICLLIILWLCLRYVRPRWGRYPIVAILCLLVYLANIYPVDSLNNSELEDFRSTIQNASLAPESERVSCVSRRQLEVTPVPLRTIE